MEQDQYTQLLTIATRVETKLDGITKISDDHERRIRGLETDNNLSKGKIGVLSAVAGAAAGWAANVLPGWFNGQPPRHP